MAAPGPVSCTKKESDPPFYLVKMKIDSASKFKTQPWFFFFFFFPQSVIMINTAQRLSKWHKVTGTRGDPTLNLYCLHHLTSSSCSQLNAVCFVDRHLNNLLDFFLLFFFLSLRRGGGVVLFLFYDAGLDFKCLSTVTVSAILK